VTARRGNPGRLSRRLVLQRPVALAGGGLTYTNAATVWAAVEPVSADLALDDGRPAGIARFHVVIRHRDDVAAGWRCLDGDRVLTVQAGRPEDADRRYVVLTVEEEGR
jgi:SPP1 family predicted phage head-tail adaptor